MPARRGDLIDICQNDEDYDQRAVRCGACGLSTDWHGGDAHDNAIDDWNDRPHMNNLIKRMRAKHRKAIEQRDARIMELQDRLDRESRLRREAEERGRSRI